MAKRIDQITHEITDFHQLDGNEYLIISDLDDKWYSKKVQLNTLKDFCSCIGKIESSDIQADYFHFQRLPTGGQSSRWGCGIQKFNLKFNSIDISVPLGIPATFPESVICYECNCEHCNIKFNNTLSTDMGVLVDDKDSPYNNTNVFYTNNKKAYVKDGKWIVEEIS